MRPATQDRHPAPPALEVDPAFAESLTRPRPRPGPSGPITSADDPRFPSLDPYVQAQVRRGAKVWLIPALPEPARRQRYATRDGQSPFRMDR